MTRKCISGKPFPKRLAKNAFFHKTFSEEKKGLKLHQQFWFSQGFFPAGKKALPIQ